MQDLDDWKEVARRVADKVKFREGMAARPVGGAGVLPEACMPEPVKAAPRHEWTIADLADKATEFLHDFVFEPAVWKAVDLTGVRNRRRRAAIFNAIQRELTGRSVAARNGRRNQAGQVSPGSPRRRKQVKK